MIEAGFRGNLLVQRILDAASELGGDPDSLKERLGALQANHTERLFVVANRLIETTILDPAFQRDLRALLAEDGVASSLLDADPMAAFEQGDLLWQYLANDGVEVPS
jgi:hypothetical protein